MGTRVEGKCNRRNWRNEIITLRALLKVAIRALHDNGCMMPKELRIWLRAQQVVKVKDKVRAEITVDMAQQHMNEIEFPPDWEE